MTEKQIKSAIISALKQGERVYINDKNEVWTNTPDYHNVTLQTANILYWINPHDAILKKPNSDGTDDTYFSHSGNSTLDETRFLTVTQLKELLTC